MRCTISVYYSNFYDAWTVSVRDNHTGEAHEPECFGDEKEACAYARTLGWKRNS